MNKNLKNYNNIFFVGICGISMSGLAAILKSQGKNVRGSDLYAKKWKKKFDLLGIKIFSKHKKSNVYNSDLVVFSGAIPSNNPEIVYAKQNNIEVVERSELLYLISKSYKNVIAISGTHGKTTTTAMISYIFLLSGFNPTIHLGGEFDFINGNVHLGGKEFFITEACEFRNSFLSLKPDVSVITNIEEEHLDYFKTFENEKNSFIKFSQKTKKCCFINLKHAQLFKKCEKLKSFGLSENSDFYAKDIKKGEDFKYNFNCYAKKDVYIGRYKVNVFGFHNIENALAAIAVCKHFGIEDKLIYIGLKTFNNVHRRFEQVGNFNRCPVIHDYAHHPTEIFSTIKTAKEVFEKKIVCIFQPHTYSRTKLLIDGFSKCFDGLDSLYLMKTYSAREKYEYLGSAEFLKEVVLKQNPNFIVKGVFNKKNIIKQLKVDNITDSVVLFLGAGDIEDTCKKIIKKK